MQASRWEFENRALVFGLIFAVVLAASVALLWMSSLVLRKRSQAALDRRP